MTGFDSMPTPAGAREMVESAFRYIENPRKRAFLRAYALCGKKGVAARRAGLHPDSIYNPGWRDDPEFCEALELARLMVGDLLEAAMVERGVEGVPRVRFNRRTGEPLRDPLTCEKCGRARDEHGRSEEGGPGPNPAADCDGFEPAIYVEREFSDRLLEQLVRSHLPDRYTERVQVSSLAANVDMSRLPDVAVARIADGEDPRLVLASLLEAGGQNAKLVREALPSSTVGGRQAARGQGARGAEALQEDTDAPAPASDRNTSERMGARGANGLDDARGEEW